jgi:GNAT superfamily N-acetyltransferase
VAKKIIFSKRITYALICITCVSSVGHAAIFDYFRKCSVRVASSLAWTAPVQVRQKKVFDIKPAGTFSLWQLWGIPYSSWIRRPDVLSGEDRACNRVLLIDGEPVAGCSYEFNVLRRDAYISALGVRPACRGKGYGSFLFVDTIKELDQRNIKVIDLVAQRGHLNSAAMALYVKHGFKVMSSDLDNPWMRRENTKCQQKSSGC